MQGRLLFCPYDRARYQIQDEWTDQRYEALVDSAAQLAQRGRLDVIQQAERWHEPFVTPPARPLMTVNAIILSRWVG